MDFGEKREIVEIITEIVAKAAGKKPEEISLQSRLLEDLEFDSLDGVEMVLEVEDQLEKKGLKVKIPDEAAANFKTVKDVVQHVINQLEPPEAAVA